VIEHVSRKRKNLQSIIDAIDTCEKSTEVYARVGATAVHNKKGGSTDEVQLCRAILSNDDYALTKRKLRKLESLQSRMKVNKETTIVNAVAAANSNKQLFCFFIHC